jgi:antirestriction protein ArdC
LRVSSSGRCGRVTQAPDEEETMATRSHRPPTAEQRDARRREQLEQLRQASAALLTSDGWQRWLRTRARFHRYSLLIAIQCPHATHVAGFRSWLELGRCVRKGEKAIRILAPVRYRRHDNDQTNDDDAKPQLVGFKLAAVFDVSQTKPLPGVEPAPLDPPGQPISGASHAHLLSPLEQHAASLGFGVHYQPLDGRAGYCATREARIVIDSQLPANGQVATLVHELAHAHGIDYTRFSRAEAELIVESVACIVCGSVGLDTSSESIPYLAGWNPEQALERIELLAGRIDQLARTLEHTLEPPDDKAAATPSTAPAAIPDERSGGALDAARR